VDLVVAEFTNKKRT